MALQVRHTSVRGTQSVEAELLLVAARLHPGSADVRRAHAAMSCPAAIDWERFVPLAQHHGVLPLLHQHLSMDTFDARLVPGSALTRLRQEAERAAKRSLMLAGELVWLLGELAREGIRVVPLKGPVLAQQLYGSVALRRINDLDLLVAKADAERAAALIVRRGYRPDSSWDSDVLGPIHRDVTHHVALASTTKPYHVELHYYVHLPLGDQRHTLASVEDELERISFFGKPVWVMRPETLLVYLCVHGTYHVWRRIEWIGGVAELLRGGRISDWDRVTESVRRLTAEGALRSGLHLVHELFDVPIPTKELRGDRSARAAARSVAKRLTGNPTSIAGPTAKLIHQVRTDTGARQRVTRVWSVLFVPSLTERTAIPLPRALSPLYYVLRPARLLVHHLRRWIWHGNGC